MKTPLLASAALALSTLTYSAPAYAAELETAILAGGCFWCIEKDFEHVKGVKDVVSGYTGGTLKNPTYRKHTGHVEAVKITYDPAVVDYNQILNIFWHSVDPTDAGGQFCDRGHAYTTAIFAGNADQLKIAKASKKALEASKALSDPIATPIHDASFWTNSEDYHQDYYKKNPIRYKFYRSRCGRNQRVKQLWGDQAYTGVNYGT